MAADPSLARRKLMQGDALWKAAWAVFPPEAQRALSLAGLGEPDAWAHLGDGEDEPELEVLDTVSVLAGVHLPEFDWGAYSQDLLQLWGQSERPARAHAQRCAGVSGSQLMFEHDL